MHDMEAIGARLRADAKKNDHYTKEPMFCLQVLVRDVGYAAYAREYANNECWWNGQELEWVYDDDTIERKTDLGFNPDDAQWDGPYRYVDRWETVMVALTNEGIDDYMQLDGHNVMQRAFRSKVRTFVKSFLRCKEMIAVRHALMANGRGDDAR